MGEYTSFCFFSCPNDIISDQIFIFGNAVEVALKLVFLQSFLKALPLYL